MRVDKETLKQMHDKLYKLIKYFGFAKVKQRYITSPGFEVHLRPRARR